MEVYVKAKELLAAAKFAYNKNETRSHYRRVMIESDEHNNYTLTATDTFKLIEINSTVVDAHGSAGKVSIPLKDIKDNIKASDSVARIVTNEDKGIVGVVVYKGWGAKRERRISFECNEVPDNNLLGFCKGMLNDWGKDIEKDTTCMFVGAALLGDICNAVTSVYGKNIGIDIAFSDSHKPIYFKASAEPYNYCRGILMPLRR